MTFLEDSRDKVVEPSGCAIDLSPKGGDGEIAHSGPPEDIVEARQS